MNSPRVASAEEWQRAGDALLVKEKEATKARDALAAERRRLPMVRIEKRYVFVAPTGRRPRCEIWTPTRGGDAGTA